MLNLKYNRGTITYSNKKVESSELSSWGVFETHINSLTSESNSVYVISVFEGKKIKCVLSTVEELDWGSIDSSLWNAVKAEVESL